PPPDHTAAHVSLVLQLLGALSCPYRGSLAVLVNQLLGAEDVGGRRSGNQAPQCRNRARSARMRPARLTVGNDSESDYASIPWDFGSIGNDGRQGKRRGG